MSMVTVVAFISIIFVVSGVHLALPVLNSQLCSNWEGNVLSLITPLPPNTSFYYYAYCNDSFYNPYEEFWISVAKLAQNTSDPKWPTYLYLSDNITNLFCDGFVNITFKTTHPSAGVFKTNYNSLYGYEQHVICSLSLNDLGIIQIILWGAIIMASLVAPFTVHRFRVPTQYILNS